MKKDNLAGFWTLLIVLFILWNFVIAFGIWGGIPEGCFVKIEKLQEQIGIMYQINSRLEIQEKLTDTLNKQNEILRTQVNQEGGNFGREKRIKIP